MIKIKKLLEVWKSAGYDAESITAEYKKLYYGIQSLYENGMIKKEKRDYEHAKLDVALNKALSNEKKWRNNE